VIGDILQPTHLIFILVVALLVLGPKRLPEVGRSLGKGIRDFKHALSMDSSDEDYSPPPETHGTAAPAHEPRVSPPPEEATVVQGAPAGRAEHAEPATSRTEHAG
jgi:sec-independent protein translocase protein TatA